MKLGQELTQRSIDLAKDNNCSYYYVLATGIYSQKIYKDLGFNSLKKIMYSAALDHFGNVIVDQAGEHTHLETLAKLLQV